MNNYNHSVCLSPQQTLLSPALEICYEVLSDIAQAEWAACRPRLSSGLTAPCRKSASVPA